MKLLLFCCCLPLLFVFTEAENGPEYGVSFVNGTTDPDFHCYHEYGYYADPRECQAYYECSAWQAIHLWCPSHLWWHPILKTCHWRMETPGCYNLNHHVYFFIPNGTFDRADIICKDIYFESVAIETEEENNFLKDKAQTYEHDYYDDMHLYFWTSGKRTPGGARHFTWHAHDDVPEELTYTDWCHHKGKTIQCDPDNKSKDCLILDHDYNGWWNAAHCDMEGIFVCESPRVGATTHFPTPTTTTPHTTKSTATPTPKTTTTTTPTTTTPTTTTPPTTTSPGPYDGEFLPWNHCEREGFFGFCENYYSCEIEGSNIIRHDFSCNAGEVFTKSSNSCVPYAHGPEECKKPANPCEKAGIFHNRRNCAKFHACVADGAGHFEQQDYRCPDGWLYNYGGTGSQTTCVRPNYDHTQPPCPFAYQICPPVPLDDTNQCESHGVFRDHDDHHNFLHCSKKLNDQFGQNGPYRCPDNAFYNENHVKCEH